MGCFGGCHLMGGILSVMAGMGAGSGGAASFTPSPGSYQVTDNRPEGGATFTITATASVVWTYSGNSPAAGSVASGVSATSITFTVLEGANDKTANFTVSAGGNSWNLTMTATGIGGGGTA